jgi:hypothetical protein
MKSSSVVNLLRTEDLLPFEESLHEQSVDQMHIRQFNLIGNELDVFSDIVHLDIVLSESIRTDL